MTSAVDAETTLWVSIGVVALALTFAALGFVALSVSQNTPDEEENEITHEEPAASITGRAVYDTRYIRSDLDA